MDSILNLFKTKTSISTQDLNVTGVEKKQNIASSKSVNQQKEAHIPPVKNVHQTSPNDSQQPASHQKYKFVRHEMYLKGALPNSPATCKCVRIIHISDTHNRHYAIPNGDILLHTGDFSNTGTDEEIAYFAQWFASLPHPYKIVIGGNHEFGCDKHGREAMQARFPPGIIYLEDSGVEILGLKIWGTPWNNSSQAWGLRSRDRAGKWAAIPADTDVLMTHVPPFKILDNAWTPECFQHWGCEALLRRVRQLRTPVHCFGHVHDETGIKEVDGTVFSNAAMDLQRRASVLEVWLPIQQS